ncbi:DNA-directed RNA polymerase II subunit RPB9 [Cryptosporidium andersoni]|uniref:DNA-directed RNA polymerase II subunit RPB9 n=1 Tax=Cryptosporidium andersoni TaxID=117008 RepID=A0A1J4MSR7_9CRYT|nr:DNA-directed RNA polymerase II subunit RPB9 [Cryptosporidium andersoni]
MERNIRFCPDCNNILCPRENTETRRLFYTCRNCDYYNFADPENPEENVVNCLMYQYEGKEDILVTKGLHQDPTLGRTDEWNCRGCGHNVAVFFQLPERVCSESMTLVFVCVNCGEWVKEGKDNNEDMELADDGTDLLNQPYFNIDEMPFDAKKEES